MTPLVSEEKKVSTYDIPLGEFRGEITVSNSRFIATLAPVFSVDDARTFISRIRQEFADASHNVPAFLIGGGSSLIEHCSDDGEPSGTAGRPALSVLRGSGLGDAALVVTRYFGGTKLGTGGLVRAYGDAARMAVDGVKRGRRVPVHVALLTLPYSHFERVRSLVEHFNGNIQDEKFEADVTLKAYLPQKGFAAFQTQLKELSAGTLQAEVIETKDMLIPISRIAPDHK